MTRRGQLAVGLLALVFFTLAFTIPGDSGITGTNLDDSYPLVIEDAARRGAVSGTDIIYTHGPLGYLFQPQGLGGFRVQRLLYSALRAALAAYVSCVILLRMPWPLRIAVGVWLLHSPAPTVLNAWVAVRLMYPPALPWWKRAERWVFPALCGFCGMVKFTEMLSGVVAIGGAVAVWAYRRKWREATHIGAVFAVAVLGTWLVAGQPLDALPTYFRNAWEIAQGFATMAIAPSPLALQLGLAGVALLVVGAALVLFAAPRRVEIMLVLLPVVACIFLDWKHGYVRADNHVVNFFFPLVLYVASYLAVTSGRQRWLEGVVAVALGLGVAGLRAGGMAWGAIAPGYATFMGGSTGLLGMKSAAGRQEEAEKRRVVHQEAALPKIKAAVGRAPVDIFNYRQAYAYINDLHLSHRPVFQSFAAYTPRLQRINFDYYQSSRHPGLVLFRLESTDGRWPWLDDAPLSLHLLTDWEAIEREQGYLLMTRGSGAPRGEWRDLGGRQARWGERIPVPAHPAGSLLAITLNENQRGGWGRLKRFLYQGANLRINLYTPKESKLGYNFIPEMATERVLLSPCLESVDEMIAWQTGLMAPRQLTEFSLAPWAGHEDEFVGDLRYRLWLWTPFAARPDPEVVQRGRALIYPYLPAVPEIIIPALETIFVDGADLGTSRAPCRIEMTVPPGTPGIEGRAVVSRTQAGIGEVFVRVQLKDAKGGLIKEGAVRPGLTVTEVVQINFDFERKWVADGRCRIVLEAIMVEEAGTSADGIKNRPRMVWGPFRWKEGG